jgi:hypothetical protein
MKIAQTIALAGLFTMLASTAAQAQWPFGPAPSWPATTPSYPSINPATGLPVISDPFTGVNPFAPPKPYNPVIAQTKPKVTNVQYDAWGRPIVTVEKDEVQQSALDPYRHVIDPGSLRQVNRYEYDAYGQRVHVTGTEWTSYGKPHSNLKKTKVSMSGDGTTVVNNVNNKAYNQQLITNNTTNTFGSSATGGFGNP